MRVVFSCVGRRRYLVDFFREVLSENCDLIGLDMDGSAPALAACDRSYLMPPVFDESYMDALREIVKAEKPDIFLSLNDLEQGVLSKNRSSLERGTGARFYIPPDSTVNTCSDKWETYRFARRLGLRTPATFLNAESALAAVSDGAVRFPLIVKPRWGSGSIGLHRVEEQSDLGLALQSCQRSVAQSILAPLGVFESVIIQELIVGPEYGVDILYRYDETFAGFCAKRKLSMRAGETDKAITVAPEPFSDTIEILARALPHRGNLDCDFLERDGELFLLELNPRFGGGYPFSHLAGANHVQMLVDDFTGRKAMKEYGYRVGKAFSKYDSLSEVPSSALGWA